MRPGAAFVAWAIATMAFSMSGSTTEHARGAFEALSPDVIRDAMLELDAAESAVDTIDPSAWRSGGGPTQDANWGEELGQGTSGPVYALAVYDGALYVGGDFTHAGNVEVNHVARWNGQAWSAIGVGASGPVSCLAVHDGHLYAGGLFEIMDATTVNHIASFDGLAWSALDTGLDDAPYAMASLGSELYVAGIFSEAGGNDANHVASWDGAAWSPLGDGVPGQVWSMTTHGTDIVLGTNGGTSVWDGATWTNYGSGPGIGVVSALTSFGGDLVAGGWGGAVTRWDGAVWTSMPGLNDEIIAFGEYGGSLIAGGYFTQADGTPAERLAVWDGAAWTPMVAGTNQLVRAFAEFDGDLYFAGHFDRVQENFPFDYHLCDNIARWTGSAFAPVGSGLDFASYAVHPYAGGIAVGGAFTQAGGVPASNIGHFDGNAWTALGDGVDGHVFAVTEYGGDLIVGGNFSSASGVSNTTLIARWDGVSWHALGDGLTGNIVSDFLVRGGTLVVVGRFSGSGGTPLNNVAVWDGVSWSSQGSGLNGGVDEIVDFAGDTVIGGVFTTAGSTAVNGVARWNGSSWEPMDSGMNNSVFALSVHDGDLFAGGDFTRASGVPAGAIARWNGASWEPVGSGITGTDWPGPFIHNLVSYAGKLVATGHFDQVDGLDADNIASWDGSGWSALGSGLEYGGDPRFGWAWGMTVVDEDLYVAGGFDRAGGRSSYGIARWRDQTALESPGSAPTAAFEVPHAFPNPFRSESRIVFDVVRAGHTRATVHDARGRLIRTLTDTHAQEGTGELTWDGRDSRGWAVPAGTYFVRFDGPERSWGTRVVRAR